MIFFQFWRFFEHLRAPNLQIQVQWMLVHILTTPGTPGSVSIVERIFFSVQTATVKQSLLSPDLLQEIWIKGPNLYLIFLSKDAS